MKSQERKIIIRYESSDNQKENFIINSTTSLMKVPEVGEMLNINKLQYKVEKVVTNLNIPNPISNKNYMVDKFDGISYYIKLVRDTKNENNSVQKEEVFDSKPIIDKLDRILDLVTRDNDSNTNIINNSDNTTNNENNNEIIASLEKIKSILATTITDYDLKELKEYIRTLYGDSEKRTVTKEQQNVEETEDIVEDNKPLKTICINKQYRVLLKDKNGNTSVIKDNLCTIQGHKFKTKNVTEGNVYINNGVISTLDKITEHKANKYVGVEYNDIICNNKAFIIDDGDLSYYIKLSILNPDKVCIKTKLDDIPKYKDTSVLLNYHIRNN